MNRIKIFKSEHIYSDYYDDYGRGQLTAGSTWLEVDDEEYKKIREATAVIRKQRQLEKLKKELGEI